MVSRHCANHRIEKGISANQLARALGVQYRTAWYLAHRIRKAMVDANRPKLKGVVEIDETYIGGKQRGHRSKLKNKDVVIGVRERGGPLRFVQTPDNKADTVYAVIANNVAKDAQAIMTDESNIYNFETTQFRNVRHERIKHKDKIYVRGDVHTNTVESAFSLFKRGLTGAFHKVSFQIQHRITVIVGLDGSPKYFPIIADETHAFLTQNGRDEISADQFCQAALEDVLFKEPKPRKPRSTSSGSPHSEWS